MKVQIDISIIRQEGPLLTYEEIREYVEELADETFRSIWIDETRFDLTEITVR